MDRNRIIGNRITTVREQHNESQETLAAALGVKRQMVGYWETGERSVKAEVLYQIADRYNVSADYLLGLSEAMTMEPELKAVCDYVGLSEAAVAELHSFVDESQALRAAASEDDKLSDALISSADHLHNCSRLYSDFIATYGFQFVMNLESIERQSNKLKKACSSSTSDTLFSSVRKLKDSLDLELFRFSKFCTGISETLCGTPDAEKKYEEFGNEYFRINYGVDDGND